MLRFSFFLVPAALQEKYLIDHHWFGLHWRLPLLQIEDGKLIVLLTMLADVGGSFPGLLAQACLKVEL